MRVTCLVVVTALALVIAGCQPNGAIESSGTGKLKPSTYLTQNEPINAIPVGEAREISKDVQDITLVGRIGGSNKPFVDGLAAFTIVDSKVPYCADEEGCPTPWDYCCQTDAVKKNIATVKIVDESGRPITQNARDLLNIKELTMVVVKGKAKRDDQGNLTVSTNQVYVRQSE